MSYRRGGAGRRRDLAEPAIIEALRGAGWTVQQAHGDGVPDLVCQHPGVWSSWSAERGDYVPRPCYLCLEVKTGAGTRTASQARSLWPLVHTPAEALALAEEALQ